MDAVRRNHTATIAIIGSLVLAIILVAGTIWMGQNAKRDTEEAVRTVSLLYLDELAGRREQVVEDNLMDKVRTIHIAIDLMTPEDLSDMAHLEAYQTRMKQLLKLDKFAFVDTDGLIYSSTGTQTNIDEYRFDYKTLFEPEISIFNLGSAQERVIIAVPVQIAFQGKTLSRIHDHEHRRRHVLQHLYGERHRADQFRPRRSGHGGQFAGRYADSGI